MKDNQTVETYVCSLMDILGQKEKLLKLNQLDFKDDLDKVKEILDETYGSIEKFRQHLNNCSDWINQIKNKHNLKTSFTSNDIKVHSFSDLVITFTSLRDDSHKLQFESIYFLLVCNGIIFLQMLSENIALRGGVDMGIAINHNDEIYGNALLNPYLLESNVAKSIRIVIGEELYRYIEATASSTVESNESLDYNIKYAQMCKRLIKKDSDGIYILDYLTTPFNELDNFEFHSKKAKLFLENKSEELKKQMNYDVAKKYDMAIKYFNQSKDSIDK